MNLHSPATRRYLYGIVLAAIPVLVLLGWIAAEDVATWANLAAAILGLGAAGLALPNTPSSGGQHAAPPAYEAQPDDYEPRHRVAD